MSKARAAIDDAVAEQVSNNKTMREIEARLIAEQGTDSELVRPSIRLIRCAAIDREVHRVLSLPPHGGTLSAADYAHEVAMLTPAQKEQLNKDGQFREATEKLKAAAQEVAQCSKPSLKRIPTGSPPGTRR